MVKGNKMNPEYNILDWDSYFFGFSVAKILSKELDINALVKILHELKEKKVKLVYWSSENTNKISKESIKSIGGLLTGKKVTLVKDLTTNSDISEKISRKIVKYSSIKPNTDLLKLIVQGGIYSRFYNDPKISKKQYEELHKLWMTNSVKNNTIFIIERNQNIIGFVSLNEKNNRGNIDFIVVDKKYRGKGLATDLMLHAHDWLLKKGYKKVQADTQENNISAINMYKKLGYELEKIQKVYHIWL